MIRFINGGERKKYRAGVLWSKFVISAFIERRLSAIIYTLHALRFLCFTAEARTPRERPNSQCSSHCFVCYPLAQGRIQDLRGGPWGEPINVGLGSEPPAGSSGRAPGGSQGRSPSEAESFLSIFI